MITWDKNLTCSEKASDKARKLINLVKCGSPLAFGGYCVALAVNPANMFDIFNMAELSFRYYRDSDVRVHVVGIADDKADAAELVRELVEKIYAETGGLDAASYYLKEE